MALNYRLRFCMMSIGLLTAHGDPHMFPLRTVTLRSTEYQNPQLVGTLIFLSPTLFNLSSPSSSRPLHCSLSLGSPQLVNALIPVKLGPLPRLSCSVGLTGSPRLPRSSHYLWQGWPLAPGPVHGTRMAKAMQNMLRCAGDNLLYKYGV